MRQLIQMKESFITLKPCKLVMEISVQKIIADIEFKVTHK